MAKNLFKVGTNLLKSGSNILRASDEMPSPEFDLNPNDYVGLAGWTNGSAVPESFLDSTGKTVSQSTAASRPLFHTNVLNTKPVFTFDGTDDFLNISPYLKGKTIFFVVQSTNTTAVSVLLGGTENVIGSAASIGHFGGTSGAGSWFPIWDKAADLRSFGYTTQARFWVNGSQAARPNHVDVLRTGAWERLTLDVTRDFNIVIIGKDNAGNASGYSGMKLARLISYDVRLTDVQRKTKEDELKTLYALA